MIAADPPALLVINAGSSSIKFALFGLERTPPEAPLIEGEIDGLELPPTHDAALDEVLAQLESRAAGYRIEAVGHRVVHGGARYAEPVIITPAVLDTLESLVPLAPLHQPHNLAAIRALMRRLPKARQVACFDTAFHRSAPLHAQRFPLPRQLEEQGIRRYGFHGLSYEYIASELPKLAGGMPDRTLVAHLGAGASVCALERGRSVATTMGFTALDGLMMGTRCGTVDPGVILHLMGPGGMSLEAVSRMVYRESGLLGVSGISANMRVLLESPAPEAREAIDLFCYRAAREMGSLTVALRGLDALVFTAGIGEHASAVREAICAHLAWLGVRIDSAANAAHQRKISAADSAVSVWAIPTDEQRMIARHTQRLMA